MSIPTIGTDAGTRLLFGIGNYMYPKSRYSVGMQVVERMAARSKNSWFADMPSRCHVSAAGGDVVAIPLTYHVHDNYKSLRSAMKTRKMNIQDIVVMTYSLQMEFGSVRLEEGGSTSGHIALEPIFDMLQTEEFARLSIGIAHPPNMGYNADVLLTHEYDDAKYQSFFLCNKFPELEQLALDKVILPAIMDLMDTGEHDPRHSYTYREIMELAQRIKDKNIEMLHYDKLKDKQHKELLLHNPSYKERQTL